MFFNAGLTLRSLPTAPPSQYLQARESDEAKPELGWKPLPSVAASKALQLRSLLLRRVGSHFGLALRVLQRTQFGRNAARNGRRLTAVLETAEIGPVAPSERTAQPLARANRRVMHDIDQPLIIRCSLLVAREIAQISAGREDRGDAWNRSDFARVPGAIQGLDHFYQHNIVVDGVAIPARNIAPHLGIEGLAATLAALPARREHSPVPCGFP